MAAPRKPLTAAEKAQRATQRKQRALEAGTARVIASLINAGLIRLATHRDGPPRCELTAEGVHAVYESRAAGTDDTAEG